MKIHRILERSLMWKSTESITQYLNSVFLCVRSVQKALSKDGNINAIQLHMPFSIKIAYWCTCSGECIHQCSHMKLWLHQLSTAMLFGSNVQYIYMNFLWIFYKCTRILFAHVFILSSLHGFNKYYPFPVIFTSVK